MISVFNAPLLFFLPVLKILLFAAITLQLISSFHRGDNKIKKCGCNNNKSQQNIKWIVHNSMTGQKRTMFRHSKKHKKKYKCGFAIRLLAHLSDFVFLLC